MSVQHSAIVLDADNHEPKGCPTATSNKVYISNGTASGAWKRPAGTAYADLFIDVGATSQTLNATANVFDLLNPGTEWTQGPILNTTTTPANGSITLTNAGVYTIDFWISFTSAAAAETYFFFKHALDGVVVPRAVSVQKANALSNRVTCSSRSIVSVTAGQVLTFRAASNVAGTAITVNDADLTAVLLREA